MMRVCAAIGIAVLTACAPRPTPQVEPVEAAAPIGQFRLGHNIALAEDAERGPIAQIFSDTTLEAALQDAIAARLRSYDGDGLYHVVTRLKSVALAQPGTPVVYATQPALVADVTLYDNDTQAPLSAPVRFSVSGDTGRVSPIVGAGNARAAEAQLGGLAEALGGEIEAWLRANSDWFAVREGQVRVPYDTSVPPPDLSATFAGETALNEG